MKKNKIFGIILILITAILISSCSNNDSYEPSASYPPPSDEQTEIIDSVNEFRAIDENPFMSPFSDPKSAFSLDVNTAAYTNLRNYIFNNYVINPDQIRIEEMVNYFKYDFPEPLEGEVLSVNPTLSPCPWNDEAKLLTIGIKAQEIDFSETDNNLVFLLDVSGSMDSKDKLGLMKEAFYLLVDNLDSSDTVSVVTYAGEDSIIIEGAKGDEKAEIKEKINNLSAGGSTAGASGIVTAYQLAEQYFIPSGNNRVIIATDGDFNVGVNSESGLSALVSEKRSTGVYLTVLGFGYGNLKDNKLEALALNGNGNYAYIDSEKELQRAFIEEIGGTLTTVARDVKAQVEFNPKYVQSYRLLGYENKILTDDEFQDDDTDAGEINSGFSLAAVYEVVLYDSEFESTMDDNILKIDLRYKDPDIINEQEYEIITYCNGDDITDTPDNDIIFISSVIEFALIVRNSIYMKDANFDSVKLRLQSLEGVAGDPYKSEFVELINNLLP